MQFERLKKNHKKEILIGGMILICVISAITITTTRAKYKLTEDIKLASGTINYKPYDFKIMAMYKSDDKTNYTEINEMPESGYIINEEKSYCTTDNVTQVKGKIKTENGKHYITGITKNDKCYIWFDMKKNTSEDILLKLNITNVNNVTPTFSEAATTDEGVFKTEDGMYEGYSYYWRGAATTNHLIFANKCWRIVRINGDGTIRLIYNGTALNQTCSGNGDNSAAVIMGSTNAEKYYATSDGQKSNSSYVGWTYTLSSQRPSNNMTATSSNAKTQTEAWFNNNSNFTDAQREKVADGKFCNDRNTGQPYSSWGSGYVTTWSATEAKFAYAGIDRLWNKYQPTLSCTASDVYTLKSGAITADEVEFAGGKNGNNESYYLCTGQYYWTMTPANLRSSEVAIFSVGTTGYLSNSGVGNAYGIRPVINLDSNVTFNAGGNGTQNNPYIVVD